MTASFLAGDSTVEIKNMSDDIRATLSCLDALGKGGDTPYLYCGESGSTLRFMLPLSVTYGRGAVFFGKGKLPQRPLAPLDEEMRKNGASVTRCGADDYPDAAISGGTPIVKTAGKLHGGTFTLPGNVSSQYLTALLMALPIAEENSRIELSSPLESAGYVAMTLDVLKYFGITVLRENDTYHIKGGQRYVSPKRELTVEGDWSNGAFWLAADRICGGGIDVEGLDPGSAQGDKAMMKILEPTDGPLIVDASAVPDLVPAVCAMGALRKGTTVIANGARLRIKESDRIKTTCAMLGALGADVNEMENGILIHGKEKLAGGIVDGANDHRIVMAAAVAACGCEGPVTIKGAEAAAKSYPGFFDDYRALGGEIAEV